MNFNVVILIEFKCICNARFIVNLNVQKRSVSAVADNVEVRNIKNVKIRINNSTKFKLLYDKNYSLNKKIKLEQLRSK